MRSVTIAELKNSLSKYLALVKDGEEIVIRDRNLPVAKLVPFSPDEASDEELLLVAAGKMRLPKDPLKINELLRIPTGTVSSNDGIKALLADREEGQVTANADAGEEPVAAHRNEPVRKSRKSR